MNVPSQKTFFGVLGDRSLEREGLFKLLKVYLARKARKGESETKASIKKCYEAAIVQQSHESYHNLLTELSRSHVSFPGFRVQSTPSAYGFDIQIDFDENADFIMKEWVAMQAYCDDSISALTERVEERNQNAMIHINHIHSVLGRMNKEKDNEELSSEMPPLEDSCVFVMLNRCSLPGMAGFVVFTLQMASFGITLLEMLRQNDGSELPRSTYLGLPRGVDLMVHASQGITMPLILLVQQSLWEGSGHLFNGYNDTLRDQQVSRFWFALSNIMRMIEGLAATYVTFVLVVTADNVVDLFKDFMAMTFVSSFDNIVFNLAKMNVIGQTMKMSATRGQKLIYKINHENRYSYGKLTFKMLRRYLIHPVFLFNILLAGMYFHWAYMVMLPQQKHQYLCERLHMQLDDDVDENFSFFTGSYVLDKSQQRGEFPSYTEMRSSANDRSDRRPMVLRYCDNLKRWAIMLEEKDFTKECNLDTVYARSDVVANAEKYDIFEVSPDDWFVRYSSDRMMPLDDLFMECEDGGDLQYDLDENIGDICKEMEIDELEGPFVSTRTWSTQYKVLYHQDGSPVSVYDHVVFASPLIGRSQDLLLFLGKRWVITSRGDLTDFDDKKWKLEDYLQNEFHGYWSDFKVAFFSIAVNVQTPKDTFSPDGLKWFEATLKSKGESQAIDENKPIQNLFICAVCHDDDNPCLYEGKCKNDKCECEKGASGTLCQVIPANNGLCNPFFNKREYDFDGGDCCINTCYSSDRYKCGRDKSSEFYVGYDVCEEETCVDCWRKSIPSESLSQLVVADVCLSENGQILALIEFAGMTVRVYDNDGVNWNMRGPTVTTVKDATTDKVLISGPEFMYSSTVFSPLTVAVLSEFSVSTFTWDEIRWKKLDFTNQDQNLVTDMALKSHGQKIGLLYQEVTNDSSESYFKLFELHKDTNMWRETYTALNSEEPYKYMSLSGDGNRIAIGSNKCVELHNSTQKLTNCTDIGKEITKVQMSQSGNMLAILIRYFGFDGHIHTADVGQNKVQLKSNVLRGISTVGAKIDISNDGLHITAHSTSNEKLLFYEFKKDTWKKRYDTVLARQMSLSSNLTVLAALASSQSEDEESLTLYHRKNPCGEGMKQLRFTFVPDAFAVELSFEILYITVPSNSNSKVSNVEIMKEGIRTDKEGAMIVEDICIDANLVDHNKTNSCVGVRVYDLGLDGLRSPGAIGVSLDGSIIFSSTVSDGYKHIFPILGNMGCMGNNTGKLASSDAKSITSNKKYDVERHQRCASAECKWNEIHKFSLGENSKGYPLISLSADGLVFAMGKFYENKYAGEVFIVEYGDNGWIQRGNTIRESVPFGRFGRALSLSADGSTIVVGSPNLDNATASQVSVYKFDHLNEKWTQHGEILTQEPNDENVTLTVGSFVDISSDGSIMIYGIYAASQVECLAYAFRFNKDSNEWDRMGDCFPSFQGLRATRVKLSSDGLTVAIGNQVEFEKYNGRVVVYEYRNDSKKWERKGQDFNGTEYFGYLGASIDISSDGNVLAMSGILDEPARVYSYNSDINLWEQRGQGIIATKENSETFALSLSSSGNILAVTYDGSVTLYLYDTMSGTWSQGISQVPTFTFTNSTPFIVASADVTTIATESNNYLSILRLDEDENGISICKKNDNFFNFTIQPDQFPKDIIWSLQSKGINILGSRLSENENQTSQMLTYTKCVPPNQLYTFVINDDYGDGVCCSWGEGKFSVEWNSLEVINSSIFTSSSHLCLPQTQKTTFFSVDFGLGKGEILDPSLSWYLLDANQNILNEDKIPFQCIPSNECTYFVLHDKFADSNGINSNFKSAKVKTDSTVVLNMTSADKGFSFKKTSLGCKELECSTDSSSFEMQVLTDIYPEAFSWNLRDKYSNKILAGSGVYNKRFSYYQSSSCIPVTLDNNCLELEINQGGNSRGGLGRSDFQMSLNDQVLLKANTWDMSRTLTFGKCKKCLTNETVFDIGYYTGIELPGRFSWELKDSMNNIIIDKGGNHTQANTFIHNNGKCINFDENGCYTFRLFDGAGTGTHYKAKLDKFDIMYQKPVYYVEKHMLGKGCNFSPCSLEESVFELDFRTDDNPDAFSWELVDNNNNTLDSGSNYIDVNQPHYHKKCISVAKKQSVKLRLYVDNGNGDTSPQSSEDGVIYMVSWNGVSVKEGRLSTNKLELELNSCPQDHTRFELGIQNDQYPNEFSWELVSSNGMIMASGNNYTVGYRTHYHGECIYEPEGGDGCIRLILKDIGYFSFGGTSYSVRWDGNVIGSQSEYQSEREKAIDMRTAYDLSFKADNSLKNFTAQLTDSASNPLVSVIGGFNESDKEFKTKKCITPPENHKVYLSLNNTKDIAYVVESEGQIIADDKATTAMMNVLLSNVVDLTIQMDNQFPWRFSYFFATLSFATTPPNKGFKKNQSYSRTHKISSSLTCFYVVFQDNKKLGGIQYSVTYRDVLVQEGSTPPGEIYTLVRVPSNC